MKTSCGQRAYQQHDDEEFESLESWQHRARAVIEFFSRTLFQIDDR
jgi:hypothetical protein